MMLDEADKNTIQQLRDSGMDPKIIARKFGVGAKALCLFMAWRIEETRSLTFTEARYVYSCICRGVTRAEEIKLHLERIFKTKSFSLELVQREMEQAQEGR